MSSQKTALDLLRDIKNRPALYFGNERPFTALIGFLTGVQVGYSIARDDSSIMASDFVPEGFHRFVTERFGRTYPDGGRGWMTFVRENTNTEEEAFELFVSLREEFDTTQSS